jgi:hypothetical protein
VSTVLQPSLRSLAWSGEGALSKAFGPVVTRPLATCPPAPIQVATSPVVYSTQSPRTLPFRQLWSPFPETTDLRTGLQPQCGVERPAGLGWAGLGWAGLGRVATWG